MCMVSARTKGFKRSRPSECPRMLRKRSSLTVMVSFAARWMCGKWCTGIPGLQEAVVDAKQGGEVCLAK